MWGSDMRTLTVPLHRHHSTIFTTSPSTVLQPITAAPDTTTAFTSAPVSVPRPQPAAVAACGVRRLYSSCTTSSCSWETLALNEAVVNYAEVTQTLVSMHKGAQLRPAHRMMLGWYGPLVAAIEREQDKARKRTAPGASAVKLTAFEAHLPYLLHLPAPQLAVLTMHTMLSAALARDSKSSLDGVRFVSASQQVGQAVNLEVKMATMRRDKLKMRQFLSSVINADNGGASAGAGGGGGGGDVLSSPNVLSKLRTSRKNAWSDEMCVKLGAALLQLLVQTASLPDMAKSSFTPAFSHQTVWDHNSGAKHHVGVIVADERVLNVVLRDHEATEVMMPKLKPMIVTPRPWKSHDDGGYLSVATRVMRSHGSHMQQVAVSKGDLTLVYQGLNYLSAIPWRINSRVLEVVEQIWERGGGVADMPSQTNVAMPAVPLSGSHTGPTSRRQQQKVYSAAVRHNRNLHSLRCDVNLKLSVARQFNRRTIYFPFNLDFRGRAYPIPPHLNHIGNDLCRGLLLFEEKRRLGETGLRWLKIHTTNLWGQGKEKLPYDQRVQWCEEHIDSVHQTAISPLPVVDSPLTSSSAWWLGAEKPFEFLAACFELHAALSSHSAVDFMSSLPVHQDGSCNGLQHYAALGRDVEGGMAVNLTPSDRPQDVYTVVCNRVLERVKEDAKAGHVLAQSLDGKVTRKIVKQTVMTSVYGVTLIGARDQILARLSEATNIDWPAPAEQSVELGALYLAKTTLSSLYSAFGGARLIQDWLSTCANAMSSVQQPVSWVTPLGLPVIQPYRKQQSYSVQTIMQAVSLADHSDLLPVSSQRQRSAFPPNFIHSLDATHMLMTATRCQQAGLVFTAVHDSYWTHAGDMDRMGRMLREEFVRLYEQPILERPAERVGDALPRVRLRGRAEDGPARPAARRGQPLLLQLSGQRARLCPCGRPAMQYTAQIAPSVLGPLEHRRECCRVHSSARACQCRLSRSAGQLYCAQSLVGCTMGKCGRCMACMARTGSCSTPPVRPFLSHSPRTPSCSSATTTTCSSFTKVISACCSSSLSSRSSPATRGPSTASRLARTRSTRCNVVRHHLFAMSPTSRASVLNRLSSSLSHPCAAYAGEVGDR